MAGRGFGSVLSREENMLAWTDPKTPLDTRRLSEAACGALATWTPPESTGRSPKDTYMVRRPESEATMHPA